MMPYNGMFWILMFGHIVGEYYLQPEFLVKKRRTCIWCRLAHTVVYGAVIWLSMLPVLFARGEKISYVYVWLAVVGTHTVVVWLSDFLADKKVIAARPAREYVMFWVGQLLQLIAIFMAALLFRNGVGRTLLSNAGYYMRDALVYYIFDQAHQPIRALTIVQVLCMFMLVGKPAAHALRTVALVTDETAEEPSRMAVWTGYAERAAVVLLVLARAYWAVPLVALCKGVISWGAYAGDRKATERFLLLTFVSILLAVLIVLMCGPAPTISWEYEHEFPAPIGTSGQPNG